MSQRIYKTRYRNLHVYRNGVGSVYVSHKGRTWIINRIADLKGEWVAYDRDDSGTVWDPAPTLNDILERLNVL